MRDEQRDAYRDEERDDERERRHEHGAEQQRADVAPEARRLAAGETRDDVAVRPLVSADERPCAEQQEQRDCGEHDEDEYAACVGDAAEDAVGFLAADRFRQRRVCGWLCGWFRCR